MILQKVEKRPTENGFAQSSLRHGTHILWNEAYFEVCRNEESRSAIEHPAIAQEVISPVPFYEAVGHVWFFMRDPSVPYEFTTGK